MAYDAKEGAVVELELSTAEEQDLVARGSLEIVPRTYKVVGEHFQVFGADPGEKFEAALTAGQEAALLEGGHIKLVEDEPKKKTKGGKKSG